MVQTGHLFAPLPEVIRDDMAFIDRPALLPPRLGDPEDAKRASSPTTTVS